MTNEMFILKEEFENFASMVQLLINLHNKPNPVGEVRIISNGNKIRIGIDDNLSNEDAIFILTAAIDNLLAR